jgi:hypothetical protein
VQHLREGGFHPRARTRGKDDDGCRMAHQVRPRRPRPPGR